MSERRKIQLTKAKEDVKGQGNVTERVSGVARIGEFILKDGAFASKIQAELDRVYYS